MCVNHDRSGNATIPADFTLSVTEFCTARPGLAICFDYGNETKVSPQPMLTIGSDEPVMTSHTQPRHVASSQNASWAVLVNPLVTALCAKLREDD